MNTTIPKFPSTRTQTAAALYLMLCGKKISHLDFQNDSRSYRLSDPIYRLRNYDWPVDDEYRTGGIAKYSGQRTRYKVYFIDSLQLTQLRKVLDGRLDKFINAFESRQAVATCPDKKTTS